MMAKNLLTMFLNIFGEKVTSQLVPDLSGFYNRQNQLQEIKYLDKSDYLEYLFPHLQNKFALINRSQIALIDDSQINIYGAKEYGFLQFTILLILTKGHLFHFLPNMVLRCFNRCIEF